MPTMLKSSHFCKSKKKTIGKISSLLPNKSIKIRVFVW